MKSLEKKISLLLMGLLISQGGTAMPKKRTLLCITAVLSATTLAFQFTPLKEQLPWSETSKRKTQLENERITATQAFRTSPEKRHEILLAVYNRLRKECLQFKQPSMPLALESPLRVGELKEIHRITELWLQEDRYLEDQRKVEMYLEKARLEPHPHNVRTAEAALKNFLKQETWVLFYALFADDSSMTNSDSDHEAELLKTRKFLMEKAPHPLFSQY